MNRAPFSTPSGPDEFEHTTASREACGSCGEWVYPRRKAGTDSPFAFPPSCEVCGAALVPANEETAE